MIVFERLLDMIDQRPEGAKVDISAIRRAFSPSDAEIVAAIERLIVANRLDRATLRRRVAQPKKSLAGIVRGLSHDAEPAKPLWDRIEAERKRRGLSIMAASVEIWGNKSRIYSLLERPTCRAATASKIRDWLNSETAAEAPRAEPTEPPQPRAEAKGGGAARPADAPPPDRKTKRRGPPTMEERARRWEEKRNTRGASGTARKASSAGGSPPATRISDRAPPDPSAKGPHPEAEPLAVAPLAVESADAAIDTQPRPALEEPKRRDPTQKPDTPLMDLADRQSVRAHQNIQAIKRGQEAEATRLLDAGVDPKTQSSFLGNLMRSIQRRRENEAREADPIEQAKLKIRRKTRLPCYGAEFADPPGPAGQFVVGNRMVDRAELIRYAGSLGA